MKHMLKRRKKRNSGRKKRNRWAGGEGAQAALFEPGTVNVQSRHRNLIAFQLEVGLLLRVMRAAAANGADRLEVKLTMRALPGSGAEGAPVGRPYLTYTSKGQNLHMVQDLPISKPYPPSGACLLCP